MKGGGVFIWGRLYHEIPLQITTASGYQMQHYALAPASKQLIHKGRKP